MSSVQPSKLEKEKQRLLQEKCQSLLNEMLRDDDNKYCVDCDAKGPRWASWNLGIFLCIRCAGIHRNLGVHISRVKSVNLDTWKPDQVVTMQQMGNSRARAVYEASLPDNHRRPQTDAALESFIRAKYEHKKYIAKEWVPTKIPIVNWDSEIEESIKKKKEVKKPFNALPLSTVSSSVIPIPKPKPVEKIVVEKEKDKEKTQSALVDISTLMNDTPAQQTTDADDLFGLSGLDLSGGSGLNPQILNNPDALNNSGQKMTNASIMSLYGNFVSAQAPQPQGQQQNPFATPMFGQQGQGGNPFPQQQQQQQFGAVQPPQQQQFYGGQMPPGGNMRQNMHPDLSQLGNNSSPMGGLQNLYATGQPNFLGNAPPPRAVGTQGFLNSNSNSYRSNPTTGPFSGFGLG